MRTAEQGREWLAETGQCHLFFFEGGRLLPVSDRTRVLRHPPQRGRSFPAAPLPENESEFVLTRTDML
jgi:hypothetical protein